MVQTLTTTANALTAFAIVQNQALSYALSKREMLYRFRVKRTVWSLVAWNLIVYALPVWWCAYEAIQISQAGDPRVKFIAVVLMWCRVVGILLFGSLSVSLAGLYETAGRWRQSKTDFS
jgi:apolipoprotein N-acyltransferase